MNRRTLLQRFVAVVAAFVAVPAVQVEAAPDTTMHDSDLRSYDSGYSQALRDRGLISDPVPLTFEEMQADDLNRPWRELAPEQRQAAWQAEEAARRSTPTYTAFRIEPLT